LCVRLVALNIAEPDHKPNLPQAVRNVATELASIGGRLTEEKQHDIARQLELPPLSISAIELTDVRDQLAREREGSKRPFCRRAVIARMTAGVLPSDPDEVEEYNRAWGEAGGKGTFGWGIRQRLRAWREGAKKPRVNGRGHE
jgi:hypothetical protein